MFSWLAFYVNPSIQTFTFCCNLCATYASENPKPCFDVCHIWFGIFSQWRFGQLQRVIMALVCSEEAWCKAGSYVDRPTPPDDWLHEPRSHVSCLFSLGVLQVWNCGVINISK